MANLEKSYERYKRRKMWIRHLERVRIRNLGGGGPGKIEVSKF